MGGGPLVGEVRAGAKSDCGGAENAVGVGIDCGRSDCRDPVGGRLSGGDSGDCYGACLWGMGRMVVIRRVCGGCVGADSDTGKGAGMASELEDLARIL